MVPEDPREALEARMMADVFDDYVNAPMQGIVGNALRGEDERDPRGVVDAHATLDRCYAWLEPRLQAKEWAAGGRFTIADCGAMPANLTIFARFSVWIKVVRHVLRLEPS